MTLPGSHQEFDVILYRGKDGGDKSRPLLIFPRKYTAKDAFEFLGEVIKSKEIEKIYKERFKNLNADLTVELSKAALKAIPMVNSLKNTS